MSGTIELAERLGMKLATLLLAGVLAACMVRMAPGFEFDATQLDPRLTSQSVQAMRSERALNGDLLQFCKEYLGQARKGDFGYSLLFRRPVSELIAARARTTAKLLALGLLASWTLAFALACLAVTLKDSGFSAGASATSAAFLCVPSAVLALVTIILRLPSWMAVALIVFPKVLTYARNLLLQAQDMPHVLAASAAGCGPGRILVLHLLPVAAPQILALAGVSVSMAIGAAIPVESLLGVPGLGHLAWQAALGRDLPLLVGVTLVVSAVTLTANTLAELATAALSTRA